MTDLPEDIEVTTKVLWMNHNFLVSPDWSRLQRLTVLEEADFSHNSISAILLKASSPMHHLDLSYNNMSELPSFQFLEELTILNLNNNNLGFLADGAFNELPNIIELHLKNNNISLLHDTVFQKLHSLTHIHLRNNNLSSLPQNLLKDRTNLEVLDISNNLLRIIPPGFFDSVYIVYLYAFGNFWKCDCSALYFAEWISDEGSLYDEYTFPNDSSVVCWEPKVQKGKALGELTEDDLCVKTPIPLMAARTTSSVSTTTRIFSEELQKSTQPQQTTELSIMATTSSFSRTLLDRLSTILSSPSTGPLERTSARVSQFPSPTSNISSPDSFTGSGESPTSLHVTKTTTSAPSSSLISTATSAPSSTPLHEETSVLTVPHSSSSAEMHSLLSSLLPIIRTENTSGAFADPTNTVTSKMHTNHQTILDTTSPDSTPMSTATSKIWGALSQTSTDVLDDASNTYSSPTRHGVDNDPMVSTIIDVDDTTTLAQLLTPPKSNPTHFPLSTKVPALQVICKVPRPPPRISGWEALRLALTSLWEEIFGSPCLSTAMPRLLLLLFHILLASLLLYCLLKLRNSRKVVHSRKGVRKADLQSLLFQNEIINHPINVRKRRAEHGDCPERHENSTLWYRLRHFSKDDGYAVSLTYF
uniref:platelet glycoprotein Ib alpha chain-like n=1 Tax=Myxine glutinosa TaxID=7769 RepID=UPI00358EA904